MCISAEDLAAQAPVPSAEDRVKPVERSIANFEPQLPPEAAWLTLAAYRRHDMCAGKVAMVPVDDASARVRARIACTAVT